MATNDIDIKPDHQYTLDESDDSENLDNYIAPKGGSRSGVLMNGNVTLNDYVGHWLSTVKRGKVKPSTYDRLLTSSESLASYRISSLAICQITPEDCENYVDQLAGAGYSLTTIKKQMLIVSAPMTYAYNHRVIQFNPTACMKPPSKANVQKARKKPEAYTQEEQDKLLAVLRTRERPAYAAVELMLETGMRPGEVLGFEKEDIHLDKRFIYVHRTMVNLANQESGVRLSYVQDGAKSETSNRRVPLSQRALEIANEILNSDTVHPFEMADHSRVGYESMRWCCIKACQKAGIPYRGLHVFRHTFATNLFYKGVNVKILSQILGHSETSVTMNIYIHLYGDGFSEMLAAVG